MSDAFHLLSDVASFIVAIAAIYLAEKPPTKSKLSCLYPCAVFIDMLRRTHLWFPPG